MRSVVLLGMIALGGLASAPARAQVCADGHVVTPETAGRCCWPGQVWSSELNRCDGAPVCPEGWAGDGGGCVRLAPVTPPSTALITPIVPTPITPTPSAPVAPMIAAQDISPPPPPTPHSADWRTRFDEIQQEASAAPASPVSTSRGARPRSSSGHADFGLLSAGGVLLGLGYVGAIGAGIDLLTQAVPCNGWGGATFVPVAGAPIGAGGFAACWQPPVHIGGFTIGLSQSHHDAIVGIEIVASIVQIVGLVLLIVGASSTVYDEDDAVSFGPDGLRVAF
jgi:hypothetical protein